MRERVCRLQLFLVLASAVILGSETRRTRDHTLLSQIRDSPNLEGQVPVFISPRKRVAQLYPQALGSLFVASYDTQGYGGGIRTRFHAGELPLSSSILLNCPPYSTVAWTQQKTPFPVEHLYYCMRIRCSGNVFSEPLSRNGYCICLSRGHCIVPALHATIYSAIRRISFLIFLSPICHYVSRI
jgi:hypothetical protein